MDQKDIDAELKKAQSELATWQATDAFVQKVAATESLLQSALLFSKSGINFLFDAMILAEFIQLRQTAEVRLADAREDWPDGFIGERATPVPVEITEVLEPGRRRGDEYRKAEKEGQRGDGGPDDWRAVAGKIPAALEDGIKKKVGKNYASKPLFVVYLNMNDYGLLQKETEATIALLKARYKANFQDTCVIWKGKLY